MTESGSAKEYLQRHNLHLLFEHLTYQVLTERPEEPLRFIFDKIGQRIGVDTSSLKSYPPSKPDYKIIFVLGGPGCGKGTQCVKLVEEGHVLTVSSGYLLRAEVERGTPESRQLQEDMQVGRLVPKDIVTRLLKNYVMKQKKGSIILLDGYPREMGQVLMFEGEMELCEFALYFSCPDEVLVSRLLGRKRADDNESTVKNRLHTFHEETHPVIEYYKRLNKLKTIDANRPLQQVYKDVKSIMMALK